MKKDLQEGITLSENLEFEKAYEFFDNVVKEEPKNIDAIYFRSFIDFFHLKNNRFVTYQDFKMLVDKKTKYYNLVLPLLVIICDDLELNDDVIKYGSIAIEYESPYLNDIKSILIKSLKQSSNPNNQIKALVLIDDILENDEDATIEYHLQKADIQIMFNDFEGAEKSIEKMFTLFSPNGSIYYMKGKVAYSIFSSTNDKNYLEEAKKSFEISLQFDPTIIDSRLILAEIFAYEQNLDKALEIIDGFNLLLDENATEIDKKKFYADLVVEKVKICESAKNYDLGLEICNDFLKTNDSWKVHYSLGYILNVTATSNKELEQSKNHILKAYNEEKDVYFLADIVSINIILKKYEENIILLDEAIKLYPQNGLVYYLLADNTLRTNYDYDLLYSYYKKAYEYGYLDEISFLSNTMFLTDNPKKQGKKLKKLLLKSNDLNVWEKRKQGIRYLFGECGFKQNVFKANHILLECNDLEPNEPCILSILGRSFEAIGDDDSAFDCYIDAYENYNSDIHATCNCACGYLAYSFYNGIGTLKDIEKAKSLILDAIENEKEFSSAINIYFYAFFALLDEKEFDKKLALKYLSSDYPFDRYDIVRALQVNKLCNKLNIEEKYNKNDFKIILKNSNKEYKKYYKLNKDNDVIYPYKKSF